MRINPDPHRRSDRSEAQLNPKACRCAIHESRAVAISRHHRWNTIQITVISPTCMPVGMRVMTNVTAQPPQRMLVAVIVVVMVVLASAAGAMANAVAPITPAHSRTWVNCLERTLVGADSFVVIALLELHSASIRQG